MGLDKLRPYQELLRVIRAFPGPSRLMKRNWFVSCMLGGGGLQKFAIVLLGLSREQGNICIDIFVNHRDHIPLFPTHHQ